MYAADVFIALGEYQMKVLCGEDVKFTPKEVDRPLDNALGTFLRIYGAPHPEPAAREANSHGT